jgi:hypothetical protein
MDSCSSYFLLGMIYYRVEVSLVFLFQFFSESLILLFQILELYFDKIAKSTLVLEISELNLTLCFRRIKLYWKYYKYIVKHWTSSPILNT